MIVLPRRSNRRSPKGVRRADRSRPPLPDWTADVSDAGPAGQERRPVGGRAVAVDALDLDGGADLAVKLGVAVHVLDEVAVDAVHSLFEVDVKLMNGQPVALRRGGPVKRGLLFGRGIFGAIPLLELVRASDRGHQGRRRIVGDRLAAVVEQLAVPVFLEDRPKDPAVAMEVGELRVLRLRVQVGDPRQECRVRPVALRGRLVRVRHHRAGEFLGGRMFLLPRDTSARRRSLRPTTCSQCSCS